MAKKTVTLYIDDASIRVLLVQGKRIKKWADLPLEPGLVKNATIIKGAEVAAKIKQLFQVRKIKTKKVNLGISGLHCFSRPITLPRLPKVMLAEAVRREAKRVLPVPPEKLYLSWQSLPAPEGKSWAFLVAIPCKAADALFKMLRQAGLKPDLMDLKPLLLARVVKEATAIIVDAQPTEFDIVIMSDGVPQPIRTVPIPSEALSWQEKLPMIRNELSRTIEFYDSNNPEERLDPDVPIYVSGELANQSEACQSLSDELGHPVLPLPSPLECPDGLEPNRYLANIGLILKKLSPATEPGLAVTDLNVLPTAYRPEPISLTRVLALPSAVIAIASLFFLAALIQNTSADITSLHGQLDTTEQLLMQKLAYQQQLTEKIAELEKEIAEAENPSGNFDRAIANLKQQSNQVNGNLEVTVNSLPVDINLTSLSHTTSILTIKGGTPGEEEVLSYLRELDASDRFSDITITSLKRITEERMDFTLVLRAGE
ncbi:PilN domain-containing protein [Chloroflexota bacterium]